MTPTRKTKQALPGQRQTKQRALVYDVIRGARGPLTVPEIHVQVRKAMPQTGIATIYRTIKLLHEKNWIEAVVMPSGETRYESADLGHHHHFKCKVCGEVFDIDHCPMSMPKGSVLPGGFVLHEHEITMYGICPHCL